MFRLLGVLSNAVDAVLDGFKRLKQNVQAAVHRFRTKDRVGCPPLQVDILEDLRERVLVITSKDAASPDRDLVACPDVFPMATPPLAECSPRDVNNGSQSTRALFHDPLQPLSPMGVFGIFSNAFSPTIEDQPAALSSPAEMQSPSSSDGSDTQYTPMFDALNSPTEASTAPTTPGSDVMQIGGTMEGPPPSHEAKEDCSDDDLPLSALMIHGVRRKASRRHGISGDLLLKRKDVPLWVPDVIQGEPTSSDSLAAIDDDKDQWENIDISDGAICEESTLEEREEVLDISALPTSSEAVEAAAKVPDTPPRIKPCAVAPNWCEGWLRSDGSPGMADDASIYSLDSYAPTATVTPHPKRESSCSIPCITLTPPSRPPSPRMSLSSLAGPDFEIVIDEEEFNRREAAAARNGLGDIFSAATLLVPSSTLLPRYVDVDEEEQMNEELALKKQRRNACRLNASSIDIIMAGLDQEFPDTPLGSPMIDPAELSQDIVDLQAEDFDDGATGLGLAMLRPSSCALSASPTSTVRNSVADLSGETLLIEDELESKFSDSSDEEDARDAFSQMANDMLMKHVRSSWPVSFGPGMPLTTILEEEEENSREFTKGESVLGPSAVITSSAVVGTSLMGKRRRFSMVGPTIGASNIVKASRSKRLSAPPSLYSNSRARQSHQSLPSLGPPGVRPPRYTRTRPSVKKEQKRSLVRPLILPQQVALRGMVAENGCGQDMSMSSERDVPVTASVGGLSESSSIESEFGMTSSRSSGCLSLYQRPWSLYVPPEQRQECPLDDSASTPNSSSVDVSEVAQAVTCSESKCTPDLTKDDGVFEEEMESVDLGCDIPLFLNSSSVEVQGLDGILSILDTMEFPVNSTSVYQHRNSSEVSIFMNEGPSGDGCQWVLDDVEKGGFGFSEEDVMGLVGESTVVGVDGELVGECDVGTADVGVQRPWSGSEFVSYYDGSEPSLEDWPGVAV